MNSKRKSLIMRQLKAGYLIRRYWEGSPITGIVRHELLGVKGLTMLEVAELGNIVEPCAEIHGEFKPLKMKMSLRLEK